MATNTKNFKFKKPDESDFYDVQDQNGNWDMADEELEKLNAPTFEDYSGGTFLPEASSAAAACRADAALRGYSGYLHSRAPSDTGHIHRPAGDAESHPSAPAS